VQREPSKLPRAKPPKRSPKSTSQGERRGVLSWLAHPPPTIIFSYPSGIIFTRVCGVAQGELRRLQDETLVLEDATGDEKRMLLSTLLLLLRRRPRTCRPLKEEREGFQSFFFLCAHSSGFQRLTNSSLNDVFEPVAHLLCSMERKNANENNDV